LILVLKKCNSYLSALSWLSSLKELDWNIGYQIKVSKIKEKRSLDQNRLYWLYLTCISHETGNDKNDIHEYCKEKFLIYRDIVIFNDVIKITGTTTNLDTKMFNEYLENIIRFAGELGITLPNPSDKNFEHFKEHYNQYL
jgi:hypothetical protein